ncbi:MAG: Ig-like domain-containing protein [Chitinophagaceae bacterium]|jgi:hypothetical protein|nr:Ig-like domain-containing protein [Chitinophagaceae bacterium]
MYKKGAFFFLFILAVVVNRLFTGCAVIVPPGGGPRDTLPPVLISADPKDSSTNFSAKQVTLTFNEYVQLDDIFTNLLVSPIPKNIPTVQSNLQRITIRIKDTLEPNTTYSYNFGRAIKDVNEGNQYKNFTYVFSTGSYIDSGTISGKVILAETGKTDSTLIAILHKNLSDTAVEKIAPRYYAKLDSAGKFTFKYLPTDTFNVFVIPNEYVKKYVDSTQMFAFLDHPVVATANKQKPLIFYAYEEAKPEKKKSNTGSGGNAANNKNLEKKKAEEKKKQLKVSVTLDNGKQDILSNMQLSFSKPLKTFDSAKIILTDTSYHPIPDVKIFHNPLDTTYSHFFLQNTWQEDFPYVLVVKKDAAVDIADSSLNKNDTIKFSTKKEAEYAGIMLRFPNVDLSKNPVLQLYQSDKLVDSIPIPANKQITRKLYHSGDYELRILYDLNKNGKWDPGNYKKHLQPEVVEAIKEKFTFKPNWSNEWDNIKVAE